MAIKGVKNSPLLRVKGLTPIKIPVLAHLLVDYPDRRAAELLF